MSHPDLGRELPNAPEAERGVLASLILAPEEVLDICEEKGVTPDTFYYPAHGRLYKAMRRLRDDGKPLEFITLVQHLRDRQELELIGGAAYINELTIMLPSGANVSFYLDALLEKDAARRIIIEATTQARRAYANVSPAEIADSLESFLADLRPPERKMSTMKELVMRTVSNIQTLYDTRGKVLGLDTGFSGLNILTNGLRDAVMYVIAARPSMGKTALLMNIVEAVAVEAAKPVAVFSLEMSAEQLIQRALCSMAKVNLQAIARGFLSERDFPALMAAAERLAKAPIFLDDTSGLEIQRLRARCRQLKRSHNIQAVFIDYLQLLRSAQHSNDRQLEVADISGNLKAMAKELNIPVVVLAQINRNSERRKGDSKGRPRLSDIRESGAIEQDGDVIGLLHREEYYCETEEEKDEAKGKATLILAKNKFGATGDINLTFLKEFTRFVDRAEGPEMTEQTEML